jgi:DNA-binding NarL/FixJ family response regulator
VNDSNSTIRIVLVRVQALYAEAVKLALDQEQDLAVVAESPSPADGAEVACRASAHVAVIDGSLLDSGPAAIAAFGERVPACRVLFLADPRDEETLPDVLEAGVSGLLTKDRPLSELVAAVRAVHGGDMFIPQGMLRPLVSELIRRRRDRNDALARTSRLTPREKEVLALLARGLDTTEIARELVISPETARTHIQHVLCKLGVHSRLEATALIANTDILDALAGPQPVGAVPAEGG